MSAQRFKTSYNHFVSTLILFALIYSHAFTHCFWCLTRLPDPRIRENAIARSRKPAFDLSDHGKLEYHSSHVDKLRAKGKFFNSQTCGLNNCNPVQSHPQPTVLGTMCSLHNCFTADDQKQVYSDGQSRCFPVPQNMSNPLSILLGRRT